MDVTFSDISKRYGKKIVLSHINMTFNGGALHILTGDNGAGKTTLISILSGEETADSGYIALDGRMVCWSGVKEARAQGIICVRQHPILSPWLSARDNILVGAENARRGVHHKVLLDEMDKICTHWSPALDMDKKAGRMTGSDRLFTALDSALLCRPRVLLLDEPTALLGKKERDALYEHLIAETKQGLNAIVITHHKEEAQSYCQSITNMTRATRHSSSLSDPSALLQGAQRKECTLRINYPIGAIPFNAQHGTVTLVRGENNALGAIEEDIIRNAAAWRRQGAGIIPTDRTHTASHPTLTVSQVLCACHHGKVDDSYAQLLIEGGGVDIKPKDRASSLSGGMLERLIMVRELYTRPALIFAFNPLQGLDYASQKDTVDAMRSAARGGSAVLVVSNAPYPQEEADRVVNV